MHFLAHLFSIHTVSAQGRVNYTAMVIAQQQDDKMKADRTNILEDVKFGQTDATLLCNV